MAAFAQVMDRLVEFQTEMNDDDIQRLEHAIAAYDQDPQGGGLLDEVKSLAVKGVAEAHYFIGSLYECEGKGRSPDAKRALFHYEIAIKELAYVEAYLSAARLCISDSSLPQDLAKAKGYYETVAESTDNIIANFRLGIIYRIGMGTGQDLSRSRQFFSRAIDKGSLFARIAVAELEFHEGNYLRWIFRRCENVLLGLFFTFFRSRDYRLRVW